jgi:hypothetical protein
MIEDPKAAGPVFSGDHITNLYYLNQLYGKIACNVSEKMKLVLGVEIPISAGVWGGTYLISHPNGNAKRRIWRFYSIVNLPQIAVLDNKSNMEKLIGHYYSTFAEAFRPYGLDLDLKMWGGKLPYSNKTKPSVTMHMEDSTETVRWLRAFFVWNQVSWEESIIHDLVRNIKVLKESLDMRKKPVGKAPDETKYLMQDIIITYETIREACSPDFMEHADSIIQEVKDCFLKGLHNSNLIQELYLKIFHGAIIYGFEEALQGPFGKEGLNIHKIQDWPVEKINWVPEELKEKLIPPIQNIFAGFKATLEKEGKPT